MVELYAQAAFSLAEASVDDAQAAALSRLRPREREFYERLVDVSVTEFTPIDMACELGVTNRTVINWRAKLAEHGLLELQLAKQRIRSYRAIADGLQAN